MALDARDETVDRKVTHRRIQQVERAFDAGASRDTRAPCLNVMGVPGGSERPAEPLLGLLTAGERLRPEVEPRELSADHVQLVLRAGFVEPVDQRDQRADMVLG